MATPKSAVLATLGKAKNAAILNLSSGGGQARNRGLDKGIRSIASGVNVILLITQIALGVIIGDFTIALLVTGFLVWNSRQRNERLAVGLFIAGVVIVLVLVVVVAAY